MESTPILVKILVSVVYGIVLGIISIPISKKLALSRTEDPAAVAPLNKRSIHILSIVLSVAASLGITFGADSADIFVRNLLLLIPIFGIIFVDALVRKIPNPLLLTMLVIELGYVIYHCISTKSMEIFPSIFVGFFVGMVVCLIPSLL